MISTRWAFPIGALSLLAGTFFAGTYVGKRVVPAKVTTDRRETLEELARTRAKVAELTVENERLKVDTKVRTVTIFRPDGSKEREEKTLEKHVELEKQKRTDKVEEKASDTQRKTDTAVKTVTDTRPEWRVGLLAGGTLSAPALPIAGPLALGIQVERRIAGPFSVGVWGLSSGQAGVSLSVSW